MAQSLYSKTTVVFVSFNLLFVTSNLYTPSTSTYLPQCSHIESGLWKVFIGYSKHLLKSGIKILLKHTFNCSYGNILFQSSQYFGSIRLTVLGITIALKHTFNFLCTLYISGESGLGKSTLINSLFLTDLYASDYPGPSNRIQKTVKVSKIVFNVWKV